MVFLLIAAGIFAASLAIVLFALATAPEGYEDANGFHLVTAPKGTTPTSAILRPGKKASGFSFRHSLGSSAGH